MHVVPVAQSVGSSQKLDRSLFDAQTSDERNDLLVRQAERAANGGRVVPGRVEGLFDIHAVVDDADLFPVYPANFGQRVCDRRADRDVKIDALVVTHAVTELAKARIIVE